MKKKYDIDQLRGAWGSGYRIGMGQRKQVHLTFEEFADCCYGRVLSSQPDNDDEPLFCWASWDGRPDELQPRCVEWYCPIWKEFMQEGKVK